MELNDDVGLTSEATMGKMSDVVEGLERMRLQFATHPIIAGLINQLSIVTGGGGTLGLEHICARIRERAREVRHTLNVENK